MNDKEFLLELREYIEDMEVKIDSKWGDGRKLQKLIADNAMPYLYAEVLRRLGEMK